jgi:uroporphyrinogen decarboxylase
MFMNKREIMLGLLETSQKLPYTPAAFFLHFGEGYQRGQPAIDRHLEYFRYTGMDFVKIQYEHPFPPVQGIERPQDWSKMPFHKLDFYEPPLQVVKGLVSAAKSEALVILTLYSPFMFARQAVEAVVHQPDANGLVVEHIRQNPEQVKRGMEIVTDSLRLFVRECVRLGIDGFYTSTQGGEVGRLDDARLFDACIRPYDLALMEEANQGTVFNVLHVCDYHLPYARLEPFKDYPGQVVSAGLELSAGRTTPREVSSLFGRPFMGGMDRLGTIARGSQDEVRQVASQALQNAPERFILGADCTVPGDTPWDNLRTAIEVAHQRV